MTSKATQSKQNKQSRPSRQSKAEQSSAQQSKAKHSKAEQSKAKQLKAKQSKAKQGKAGQAKQSKAEQRQSPEGPEGKAKAKPNWGNTRIRKAAHNTLENGPPELFRVTFSARRRKFRNCAGGARVRLSAPAKSKQLSTPSQQSFCKKK